MFSIHRNDINHIKENIEDTTMLKAPQRTCHFIRYILMLGILCLFTASLICIYRLNTAPLFNQYKIVRTYQSKMNKSIIVNGNKYASIRTILLWSSFFGDARWSLPDDTLGVGYFRDQLHCPVYHCEITNQHNFLPAVELYDAILFHTAEPFPFLQPVPKVRSTHQSYVFALMEPPGETKHLLSDETNFYNLTMTYRVDSDIVWPYKHILNIETGSIVAPLKYTHWRTPPTQWNDTKIWQLWSGKVKMAAWFVSHCKTLSKREKLAQKLQEFIEVDIYGKCGSWFCERGSQECDDLLDSEYKFYLSFENSLCIDYVTEKLYRALERQIIPVVYGGANYTRFLPPHSYIDAERFDTVAELADHLKFVANDINEYMRYFWWRRYYKLTNISPFCDLCEQLHSATLQQKMQTYTNIEEWWLGNSCRFEPYIAF